MRQNPMVTFERVDRYFMFSASVYARSGELVAVVVCSSTYYSLSSSKFIELEVGDTAVESGQTLVVLLALSE
jgi:hypothetical protein